MGQVLDGAWHKVMPPPNAVAAGEDLLSLIDVIDVIDVIDGIGAFFRVASAWVHVDRRLRPEAIRLPDAAAREAADLVWHMVCQVLCTIRSVFIGAVVGALEVFHASLAAGAAWLFGDCRR